MLSTYLFRRVGRKHQFHDYFPYDLTGIFESGRDFADSPEDNRVHLSFSFSEVCVILIPPPLYLTGINLAQDFVA